MATSDSGVEAEVESGEVAGASSRSLPEDGEDAGGSQEPEVEATEAPEEESKQEEAPEPDPPSSALGRAITELAQEAAHNKDRLLRTAADFENFRKRSRKDMRDRVKQAEERVFLDVLSVADNLERALAHAGDLEGEAVALRDGVDMVYKQFLATLERYNIKQIEAVGKTFDPERHEAIQQVFSEEELGIICFEMRKGYVRGDRLVRASMVVVSKGPEPEPEPEPEESDAPEVGEIVVDDAAAEDDALAVDDVLVEDDAGEEAEEEKAAPEPETN